MRVYPNAVLKPEEPQFLHQKPKFVARALAPLRNVEHDHAPALIPSPAALVLKGGFLFFKSERALALVRYLDILLSAALDESHETFLREPSRGRFRAICEFIFIAGDAGDRLKYVGSDHRDREYARNGDNSEHGLLQVAPPSLFSGRFLNVSHISIVYAIAWSWGYGGVELGGVGKRRERKEKMSANG